jgi:hypothetical protein
MSPLRIYVKGMRSMIAHFRFSLVLVTIAVAMTALPAVASAASLPVGGRAAGAFAVTIDPAITTLPVGRVCQVGLTASFTFTGDLAGTFTTPFSILHAGACDQPATEVFQSRGTWVGSTLGRTGSFTFVCHVG